MKAESPVAVGSTIAGKYRVERVLGHGGMGVVVVAMHDELDQRVAIKFLLPDALNDAEWVARFAREARAAARIRSEHAVKVYDVGKLENGAPFIVMEYLEGSDLQTILNDRRALPTGEAVEYVLQACEAIAEAHATGVVHRDLKPANLFVTHRADGSPCVKILDFGISKLTPLTTGGGSREQTVTNTTAIVGSPLYMSPEQMRASKNVDRRTDIWSLGVILQELVSGEPSFVANTTAELCALVLTAAPSPLSVEGAPGLGAVIAKCLEKSPESRYASVAELARALEPFGPPSVRTSVERIGRLAGSPAPAPSLSGADAPASVVAPPSAAVSRDVGFDRTEIGDSGARAAAPATTTATPGATAAAWQAPNASPKKSRLPLIAAGGALAALAVLAIVGLALTHRSTPAAESPKPEPTQTTAPVTATATPTAAATVTATATATATATVTPTAAGAERVATPTHHSPPPHAVPSAKPPPSASAKRPPAVAPLDTSGFGGRN